MINRNQIQIMAERLSLDPGEMQNIVIQTIMPSGKAVTNEQFVSFLAVANEYELNPLTKEIYAFPTKGGGLQAIVSIDGWLKIINNHPQFDGMDITENFTPDGKQLLSVTCKIYRKDRSHAIEVTEYLSECMGDAVDKYGNPTPWGRWPVRLLRHKTVIQTSRYAFSLSGICDPDEAERIQSMQDINPVDAVAEKAFYSDADFEKNLPTWLAAIAVGKHTPESVIATVSAKAELTETQKQKIKGE